MKRKLIIIIALIATFFGVKAVLNSLQQPAEGKAVVVNGEPEIVIVDVDTTTVATETIVIPEPVDPKPVDPEVIPEVVFEPLKFNGKRLGKFAKANGGKVMNLTNTYARALIGFGLDKANLPTKVVKVGGDLYFKAADGTLYVAHEGKLIKL